MVWLWQAFGAAMACSTGLPFRHHGRVTRHSGVLYGGWGVRGESSVAVFPTNAYQGGHVVGLPMVWSGVRSEPLGDGSCRRRGNLACVFVRMRAAQMLVFTTHRRGDPVSPTCPVPGAYSLPHNRSLHRPGYAEGCREETDPVAGDGCINLWLNLSRSIPAWIGFREDMYRHNCSNPWIGDLDVWSISPRRELPALSHPAKVTRLRGRGRGCAAGHSRVVSHANTCAPPKPHKVPNILFGSQIPPTTAKKHTTTHR